MPDGELPVTMWSAVPDDPSHEQIAEALESIRLCIHCKHSVGHGQNGPERYTCDRLTYTRINLVTGEPHSGHYDCMNARYGGPCGQEGKYFEPKSA